VFIERLWRSVKYVEIDLHEHPTIPAVQTGLARWFNRYNTWRPHQALGNGTPHEVYRKGASPAPTDPGQHRYEAA
jgi:putative transposase